MKLEIPYYSQFANVTLEEWQERACAPTCLKMVLDFLMSKSDQSVDDLINEGLEINAYQDGIGWIHAGLTRLSHNHGLLSYNEEFRSRGEAIEKDLVEKGIEKIKRKIDEEVPTIISCSKSFDEFHKPHQVVVVGYDDNGFYYHEPNAKSVEDGANRNVTFDTFRTHWRKFAIFFEK